MTSDNLFIVESISSIKSDALEKKIHGKLGVTALQQAHAPGYRESHTFSRQSATAALCGCGAGGFRDP